MYYCMFQKNQVHTTVLGKVLYSQQQGGRQPLDREHRKIGTPHDYSLSRSRDGNILISLENAPGRLSKAGGRSSSNKQKQPRRKHPGGCGVVLHTHTIVWQLTMSGLGSVYKQVFGPKQEKDKGGRSYCQVCGRIFRDTVRVSCFCFLFVFVSTTQT